MQTFFGKKNYWGMAVAMALLIIGFLLLGLKPADNKLALNVAPFVLLFAFLVVIPWSILKGGSKDSGSNEGV
jgi:uncharacterized membrane protein